MRLAGASFVEKELFIEKLKSIFADKAEPWGIQMAFLYGSRAWGSPRQDSDVDLAVVFENGEMSEEEVFAAMTAISVFLEKELGLEVNTIPIFEDFRKPMLYYNAMVKGIPVLVKDHGKYLAMRNEAIFQMEDFEIFGERWQLDVARRNLAALDHAGI